MKTTMNLRNVTIWTTVTLMVVPAAILVGIGIYWTINAILNPNDAATIGNTLEYALINIVYHPLLFCLFSGTPLLVSFILAIKSKLKCSAIILLIPTVLYGLYLVHVFVLLTVDLTVFPVLFIIGPLSLPVMIPVWVTALVMDRRYAKKSIAHSQSNENEVQ